MPGTSGAPFRELFVFDGALHFVGTDGAIWRIDGPDTGPLAGSPLNPGSFVEFAGSLYLSSADPSAPGTTRFDGSSFTSVDPDFLYDSGFAFDGVLYLATSVGADDGVLHASDGTTIGGPILPEPVRVGPAALVYGEAIYFAATDAADEDGLWRIALVPAAGEEPAPELPATGPDSLPYVLGGIAALTLLAGVAVLAVPRRGARSISSV